VKHLTGFTLRSSAASTTPACGPARPCCCSESTYGRIWQRVRQKALTSAQQDSPLVARPYDLRHSGVTLGLTAGIPVSLSANMGSG
jgi:hypothetical protein